MVRPVPWQHTPCCPTGPARLITYVPAALLRQPPCVVRVRGSRGLRACGACRVGSEDVEGEWADARKVRREGSVAALVQQARRAALTEFEIEVDSHTRTFFVTGEGLLRFLQMTNWE